MANKVHITNGSVNTINLNATGSVNATGLNVTDAAISNSLTADSITASSVLATTDATIDGSLIITGELITDGTGKDFQEILDTHIEDNTKHVSAESIQAVAPIAWVKYTTAPTASGDASFAIGNNAQAKRSFGVAIGASSIAQYEHDVSIGFNAQTLYTHSTAIGSDVRGNEGRTVSIGAGFTEVVNADGSTKYFSCKTEGTGSITIGAGANTLNNGDTESSNSVTIGCKALNQGADSVVIGASTNNTCVGTVMIGAGASLNINDIFGDNVVIGRNAKSTYYGRCVSVGAGANASYYGTAFGYAASAGIGSTSIGNQCNASGHESFAAGNAASATGAFSISVGYIANSTAANAIAIGTRAKVSDQGATVIRSTAEDGTYTQLYFSGANTPLANTYENGEAMMGYVVRDSAGNIMTDAEGNAMVGTQKLSVLFPNNRGENAFTPAMLGLDDEWTPKPMFRPSDLDMPQEEPTEPEEYTPLPVYPIVEPEIEEPIN